MDFVAEASDDHGLPFEAIDHEHLMWLAEVLRTEATLLVGKNAADELACSLRGLPTGQK